MKRIVGKVSGIVLMVSLLMGIADTALAWQASVSYGHLSPYGGEANSGFHRGNIVLSGGRRDITAGDDNVTWTAAQAIWIAGRFKSTERAAMVYHAFAPNSSNCSGIRIVNMAWSYGNLPGISYWSKRAGCLTGNNNEWRAIMYASPAANTAYWFQHVFGDTNYPGSNSTGEITVDSYWDGDCGPGCHIGIYKDYHGKFCVNTSNVAYAPSGGVC